ncbi:unnamed protein product [Meganyctiphanes norvegica]|uniref:Uncharacterized protein n=1 Tax=Meganyctiphanes norvegica TaxID=48144 RepID=A0AAV2RH25_MEGNR
MGSLTSKHVDQAMEQPDESFGTPKSSHVLPFDPRSPTDYISRTPITVSDTPSSSQASTPMNDEKIIKVLDLDPRSPCEEHCRTPIVIEEQTRKRHQAFKPSNLAQIVNQHQETEDDDDPRSPSSKVPRTPFEDKTYGFPGPAISKVDDHDDDDHNNENGDQVLVKKLFSEESDSEKVRRPLTSVQNAGSGNNKGPLGILQAKQCKSVEIEFSKNQSNLILKLATGQENTTTESIPASTDFVEKI